MNFKKLCISQFDQLILQILIDRRTVGGTNVIIAGYK